MKIMDKCDEIHFEEEKRAKYLVDKSDIVLTVWDGEEDETSRMIAYAKETKKRIIIINAETFKIM